HGPDDVGGDREIFRAALLVARQSKLLVFPHELEEGLQIAFKADLLPDLIHLIMDARHFFQTSLMDLFRAHVSRGSAMQRGFIKLGAIFELPDASVLCGALSLLVEESN